MGSLFKRGNSYLDLYIKKSKTPCGIGSSLNKFRLSMLGMQNYMTYGKFIVWKMDVVNCNGDVIKKSFSVDLSKYHDDDWNESIDWNFESQDLPIDIYEIRFSKYDVSSPDSSKGKFKGRNQYTIDNELIQKQKDSISKVQDEIRKKEWAARLRENEIRDSLNAIENKLFSIKKEKEKMKTESRLKYFAFGMSANFINKNRNLANNSAWQFITNPAFEASGKGVNGSTVGFNFVFSEYLVDYLGIEVLMASYRDGYYSSSSQSTYGSTNESSTYLSLLKNSFYGAGPIYTKPISKSNIDFKLIFAYSKGVLRDPTIAGIPKFKTSTLGGILGIGFRIPIEKGAFLDDVGFTKGHLGLYYETYFFKYKYGFGTLPAFNNSISVRYITTIDKSYNH